MRRFNLIKVAVLLLSIYSINSLTANAQTVTSEEIDSLVEKTRQTME